VRDLFFFSKKKPEYIFFFIVIFFLLLNCFYNTIMSSLGFGWPVSYFFFTVNDIFADFFKSIFATTSFHKQAGLKSIDFFNNSSNVHYILNNYLKFAADNFGFYSSLPNPPFYIFIMNINSYLFLFINPVLVFLMNILLILLIFFFQCRNFLTKKNNFFLVFVTCLLSYPILIFINRGHVYSAYLSLLLIQILINSYKKNYFIMTLILIILGSSGRLLSLCFVACIFNYNISFKKKIIYSLLTIIFALIFHILFIHFNDVFFHNHQTVKQYIDAFKHTGNMYQNYIVDNMGLAWRSSMYGGVKLCYLLINSFFKINLNFLFLVNYIFILLTFIFFLYFYLFINKKISFSIFSFFLCSFYILSSPETADYHLIVFLGSVLCLIKDYKPSNFEISNILIIAIGVIVSPQNYFIITILVKFFLSINLIVNEKVLINPLLILSVNLYFLYKNFHYINVNSICKKLLKK